MDGVFHRRREPGPELDAVDGRYFVFAFVTASVNSGTTL